MLIRIIRIVKSENGSEITDRESGCQPYNDLTGHAVFIFPRQTFREGFDADNNNKKSISIGSTVIIIVY